MEQTRLIALLEKHIAGQVPDPEWQELLRTAGGPKGEATIRQALETLLERTPADRPYDAARFDPILRQALDSDIPAAPLPAPRRIPIFRRIAAAAAILLLLAAGWIYFTRSKTPPAPIAQTDRFHNDIAPGHNTAILTLGGGHEILLDSAHDGAIASQGNTLINKTGNGELAYNNVKGPAAGIVYNTLTTPRGGQYQLRLPDGSKVWLNAASSITYPTAFAGNERSVTVTGEAYFEVLHKDNMPFRVKAGGRIIEDLGTHFDINAYPDEPVFKTTLLEGAVSVSGQILKPREQADIANGKTTLLKGVDVDEVVAWKDGKFRYNSVDIESIMRQAARWYDIDVEYQGKIDETFSGGISRNVNASQLLHILEITKKVTFSIEGKKIIVKPFQSN